MTQAKQLGRERIVTRVKQSSQPAPSGGGHELHHPTGAAHLSSTHPPHPNRPRPLQPIPPAATELYRTHPKDQNTLQNHQYLRARATPGGTAHEASRQVAPPHATVSFPPARPRPAPGTSRYLRSPCHSPSPCSCRSRLASSPAPPHLASVSRY